MIENLNFNVTDCFVFPDKLSKKSTRCLCVKITSQTSGPNNITLYHSFSFKAILLMLDPLPILIKNLQ